MTGEELCAWLRRQHGEYTLGLAMNHPGSTLELRHDLEVLNNYLSVLLTVALYPPQEVAHVSGG